MGKGKNSVFTKLHHNAPRSCNISTSLRLINLVFCIPFETEKTASSQQFPWMIQSPLICLTISHKIINVWFTVNKDNQGYTDKNCNFCHEMKQKGLQNIWTHAELASNSVKIKQFWLWQGNTSYFTLDKNQKHPKRQEKDKFKEPDGNT